MTKKFGVFMPHNVVLWCVNVHCPNSLELGKQTYERS